MFTEKFAKAVSIKNVKREEDKVRFSNEIQVICLPNGTRHKRSCDKLQIEEVGKFGSYT